MGEMINTVTSELTELQQFYISLYFPLPGEDLISGNLPEITGLCLSTLLCWFLKCHHPIPVPEFCGPGFSGSADFQCYIHTYLGNTHRGTVNQQTIETTEHEKVVTKKGKKMTAS